MKVVNSNATSALFAMLEELSERPHESWQCVYIKPINANDNLKNPHSAANAKAITEQLTGIKGTIYQCEDGDIIMLFQRPAKTIVGKLSAFLGDTGFAVAKGQHTYNLFGVFDLSKHWQGFYSLCVNKYLKALARTEHRHMPITAEPMPQPAPLAPMHVAQFLAAAN